jgi:hypothetical protein
LQIIEKLKKLLEGLGKQGDNKMKAKFYLKLGKWEVAANEAF